MDACFATAPLLVCSLSSRIPTDENLEAGRSGLEPVPRCQALETNTQMSLRLSAAHVSECRGDDSFFSSTLPSSRSLASTALLAPSDPAEMARVPPPGDTLSFPTTPSLLYPHFESYKLASPPRGDDAVTTFPLPRPFKTPVLPDHARLSYNEVSDRARHNHLHAGKEGEVLFVDAEGVVTAVQLDKAVRRDGLSHDNMLADRLRTCRLPSPPSTPSFDSLLRPLLPLSPSNTLPLCLSTSLVG